MFAKKNKYPDGIPLIADLTLWDDFKRAERFSEKLGIGLPGKYNCCRAIAKIKKDWHGFIRCSWNGILYDIAEINYCPECGKYLGD